MDLSQQSTENLYYMIEQIKTKLKMATAAAMKPSHFAIKDYEDVKELYDWVNGKDRFSITEMEAIVSELGRMRNQ